MLPTNRKYLIAGLVALLLILFGLTFLIKDAPPPPPPPPIEEVRMPPPPPLPTPEQIAAAEQAALMAAEAAAEQARLADIEAQKAKQASQKAAADKKASVKTPVPKKTPAATKPVPAAVAAPDASATTEPAKPKNARFNMTQDGKKMTAEDFDAWMKSQGIRIVPAKPAEPPKTEEKTGDSDQ